MGCGGSSNNKLQMKRLTDKSKKEIDDCNARIDEYQRQIDDYERDIDDLRYSRPKRK